MGRRGVALAAVAVLLPGLVAAAPLRSAVPAQAAVAATVVSELTWPLDLVAGRVATSVVAVSPPVGRAAAVQYRRAGASTWRTLLTATTGPDWLATVRLTVRRTPDAAWAWRVRSGGEWTTPVRSRDATMHWRLLVPGTATAAPVRSRVATVQATARPASPPLPLGAVQATSVVSRTLAPGLRLHSYRHGRSSQGLTVTALLGGAPTGALDAARSLAARIRASGLAARVELVVVPPGADYPAQVHALVRTGRWPLTDRSRAENRVAALARREIPAVVDPLADDGLRTTGPWRIDVLALDPGRFTGTCVASLGRSTAHRETVSAMSGDVGAIAGVNGGFFGIGQAGYEGDPMGASVSRGRLLSEAVDERTALVLDGCAARVTRVATRTRVTAPDGAASAIETVNRPAPRGSMALMTSDLGRATPRDGGVDVVVDRRGVVVAIRTPGRLVPAGHRVLHGTGAAETWLRTHARGRVTMTLTVRDLESGARVPRTATTHVVAGAVGLLRDGRTLVTGARDGHASIGMALRRQPRTLAGVTADGRLLLAAVDGRDPDRSVGVSFPEAAALLRWLGAQDGLSLDGGGSTTMVVQGAVVNHPSDGAERAVGDAVLVVPPPPG
jgi:hypothetical protein